MLPMIHIPDALTCDGSIGRDLGQRPGTILGSMGRIPGNPSDLRRQHWARSWAASEPPTGTAPPPLPRGAAGAARAAQDHKQT